MTYLRWAAWAGAGGGLLLGIYCKIVQAWTGVPVYTLLLTMDYVPVASLFDWPEWAAFAVHLLISALLGWLWGMVCRASAWRKATIRYFSAALGLAIGALLLPTTYLSELTRDSFTPEFAAAWLIGNLLFGLTLGMLLARKPSAKAA